MKNKIYLNLFLLFTSLFAFSSCSDTGTATPPRVKETEATQVNGFIYQFMQDYYLWNNKVPRKGVDLVKYDGKPDDLVKAVRYNDLDRFSRINSRGGDVAANLQNTVSKDVGLYVTRLSNRNLGVLFIKPNSPADKAGLRRGIQITKIDDVLATNVTTFDRSLPHTIVYTGSEGEKTVSLTPTSYQEGTIFKQTVVERGGKKVGYLAYSGFIGNVKSSIPEYDFVKNGLKPLFEKGIDELVVDLRYNGGGYVKFCQIFASILMPAGSNQKVFIRKVYNSNLVSFNSTTNFEADIPFNFGLKRIFFITSRRYTASASDMLVTSLMPHMDVKIVGIPYSNSGGNHTYGKFVGGPMLYESQTFYDAYPKDILKKADLAFFPMTSRFANADGFPSTNASEHKDGIKANVASNDDVSKDFGDPAEACFKECLYFIQNSKWTDGSAGRTEILPTEDINVNPITPRPLITNIR